MLSKNKSDTRENKNQLRKYRYLNYYKGKCEWRGNLVSQCPGVTVLRGAVRRGKEWSRWYHGGLSGLKWPHNHTHTLRRRSLPQSGPGPLPLSSTDSTLRFPVCCFQVSRSHCPLLPQRVPFNEPSHSSTQAWKKQNKKKPNPRTLARSSLHPPPKTTSLRFRGSWVPAPTPREFLGRTRPARENG